MAFAAARGNSGDSAAYAEIYLFVFGSPLLAAALAAVKWPRGGVVLAAIIEVILVAVTRVTNNGTYTGAITPFVIATTALVMASFAMAWLSRGDGGSRASSSGS
ncbi:MAG TPA: hypothetical protein VNU19_08835 [Candidatus Acidoferrum sp.]|nr:hypothetical protein [Candidatus Acidoferrum sp.]